MRRLILLLMCSLLLASVSVLSDGVVSAETECIIPESGPWPPCATGGSSSAPAASPNECIIPPSGPWPPCATNGGASGTTPPPTNNTNECVIPSSGPWPPCATNGSASGTTPPPAAPNPPSTAPSNGVAQQQRYSLLQTRELFLSILNTEVANESVREGSLLIPAIWQADSAVSLRDGTVHITSFDQESNIRHELEARLGAQGGQPTFELLWLDMYHQRVSEEVRQAYERQILNGFQQRLQTRLGYDAVTAISAENGVMIVHYSIAPTTHSITYSAAETRDLFLTILNEDMWKRFGDWQPNTEITLDFRKITLISSHWNGTETQRIELVARLGAANGDPLVGLERLSFNGENAAPWDRTSAESMLETNLAKRLRAELGNDVVILATVAANNTLTVTYRY